MTQLLSGVVNGGTASGLRLAEMLDTAGKTGTSGKGHDKLFIGFTPYYTAGIWSGYDDGKTSVSGALHLKLWDNVMIRIHEYALGGTENPKSFKTDGLVYSAYCKDSGELFSPECLLDIRGNRIGYGYFIKGTEPRHNCTRHKVVRIDESSGDILKYHDFRYPFGTDVALIDIENRKLPDGLIIADDEYLLPDEYKSYWHTIKRSA